VSEVAARLGAALADRYRIERELGQGGMATVYLARDLKHDRDVAIKVLHPDLGAALGAERFLSEIRTTARLQHPHILPLLDSGAADEFLYYVMPYVAGESLRQKLEREKQLSVDEVVRLGVQVAQALDYAHRHSVIHRDIKPENIFLREGEAVVTDFGIALALQEPAGVRLSQTGVSLGTPHYMSPEQTMAERHLDARTDVYSLGVVLYEMLVGEPPYTGRSAQAILAKSLTDAVPSARRLRETVPRGVDAAISKAMGKAPADRFATASQFAEALMSAPAVSFDPQSIAVLPFTSLSPDPDNEYFVDGMTEEIINALTQIRELRVTARSSSFIFKGKAASIRAVADELQVGTVLEGSVRRVGNRLRITVQLINAADGYQLWSQQYDREMHDVFAIQDEIARAICSRLKVTLAGRVGTSVFRPPTPDLEAYQLYLKGRYFWARRDGESLPKAIEYFTQALARDPGFAAAYAGLADSYVVLGVYGDLPPSEVREKGRWAAERAIAYDETLPEAHFALGLYELVFGWHFDVAEREFRRAAELAPSSARPPAWFSILTAVTGRTNEALVAARQAQALEPLSPVIHAIAAHALMYAHALDEALDSAQRALELEPTLYTALWSAGMVHGSQGKHDAAIAAFEKAAACSRRSPIILASLGWSLACVGRATDARAVVAELEQRNTGHLYPGLVYWGLAEDDRAFDLLARGFEQRAGMAWMMGSIPGNERLGRDPRWIALLQRAGLASIAEALRP
jgi:serine/threonine-protein kinase